MPVKHKFSFYDAAHLVKDYPDAYYYIIIGERSNGKTYSSLKYALKNYFEKGEQFAYVRRFGEDIRKKHLGNLFSGHIENGEVSALSHGKWTGIEYTGSRFLLNRISDDDTVERCEEPIGFAFDLNSMEHYKSISRGVIDSRDIIYFMALTIGFIYLTTRQIKK